MNKTFIKVSINALLSTLVAGVLVFAPVVLRPVFALDKPDPKATLEVSAQGFSGFFGLTGTDQTLPAVVGVAIQIILSILGLIFLILVVYGGILWMVAEGEKGKVEKARGLLFHAVFGLIIILSAYAITAFVLARLAGTISVK